MNKVELSIGIPAYNEEANIKKLVLDLLNQKKINSKLLEIIIVSDASTDGTLGEVKSIKNKKIKLVVNNSRLGQAESQNKIIKLFRGDILILLNADVLPKGDDFIEKLIKPLLKDSSVGLVGPKLTPVKARTFFEKVINFSVEFKDSIGESINNGNNLFLCRGGARAFNKEFAKKINWKDSLSEDAYSYLLCKKLGYKFIYNPKAEVYFKSPDNFSDHIKQSARFAGGPLIMAKYFDKQIVAEEYTIPKSVLINQMIKYFIKNPFYFSTYFLILIFIRLNPNKKKYYKSMWDQSKSSKNLNIQ